MRTTSILTAFALTAAATVAVAPAASAAHEMSLRASGVTILTGEAEAPGPGSESGKGVFAYRIRGGEFCYVLVAVGIDTPTAAHIHEAPAGVAGPIVIPLEAPTRGAVVDCIDDIDAGLLADIAENPENYYANVHNAPFPAGALRGQLD
jgi:hypothetical protein